MRSACAESTRRGHTRGVTLIEILIVVVIVSILIGLSGSVVPRSIENGRKRSAVFNLAAIYNAQKRHKLKTGKYYVTPPSPSAVSAINENLGLVIDDPYLGIP